MLISEQNDAIRAASVVAAAILITACGAANEGPAPPQQPHQTSAVVDMGVPRAEAADAGPRSTDVVDVGLPGPTPAPSAPAGAPGTVITLTGGPTPGDADGALAAARFSNPVNVALHGADLWVADYDTATIRQVDTQVGQVASIWTLPSGINAFGLVPGPGTTLYVQGEWDALGEQETGSLWSFDSQSGEASLLVDHAGLNRGLVLLGDGRLAMSDYQAHLLRIYDPKSNSITVLAGAAGQPGFADGAGANARFHKPGGLVIDADGALIVADSSNHRLRRVTLAGEVSSIAGDGAAATADGSLATAQLNQPWGLARDGSGAIYVTEMGGHVVRRVAQGQVKTIAGDGIAGHADGPALDARFYGLEGIAVSEDGKRVYVADGNRGDELPPYHRIRLLFR